jgi:hypothetical protein
MDGHAHPAPAGTADAFAAKLLPLRRRAEVVNGWLQDRLEHVLPALMEREAFDMWIVIAREYNEDPVIMSLLPEPEMSARRRTILVFARRPDGTVERLALNRYGLEPFYSSAWDPAQEEQYACLGRIVRERDPGSIGINVSDTFAFGDGLTHSEHAHLLFTLGSQYAPRVRGAERLCLGWLERRTTSELIVYPGIVQVGHAIIAEAFSNRVVHPGITTTEDVVWWMRQEMLDLGLRAWFQPTVEIQAIGQSYETDEGDRRTQILPGDLLHCDVGFSYLGLSTDQQQNAYVLRPGESDAPPGLKAALADANRLQDILAAAMVPGRTGNQVLSAALQQARAEGLKPSIYTHPLGYHGHAAGPTIGLWDRQDGVPGQGDYTLYNDTCYAIELNAKAEVPEWAGQEVCMALEEDAVLREDCLRWLSGRQTGLYLIE